MSLPSSCQQNLMFLRHLCSCKGDITRTPRDVGTLRHVKINALLFLSHLHTHAFVYHCSHRIFAKGKQSWFRPDRCIYGYLCSCDRDPAPRDCCYTACGVARVKIDWESSWPMILLRLSIHHYQWNHHCHPPSVFEIHWHCTDRCSTRGKRKPILLIAWGKSSEKHLLFGQLDLIGPTLPPAKWTYSFASSWKKTWKKHKLVCWER